MEGKYANIIIDISHEKVDRPFQYIIPPNLKPEIEVGTQVVIPFGKGNRSRKGYVMEISDLAEIDLVKLKEIQEVVTGGIDAQAKSIRLAWWIKEHYGSTMINALKTVLPVKLKVKPVEKRTVSLVLEKEEAEKLLLFYREKHQKARERLLGQLIAERELPQELVTGKLNVPVKTIQAMAEQGILEVTAKSRYRDPLSHLSGAQDRKKLSRGQQEIVEDILMDFSQNRLGLYLLHGITGSGKTEVYMELIAGVIKEGKQAILLIPEIALTYQTVLRFLKRFGGRIAMMNSKLSQGERYDQFERAKNGEVDIMIGPRSALFTPFPRIGLIIIDEEHEGSYKSEAMPRYHAREVAMEIASMHGAGLVLGSATPSLEAYYLMKQAEAAGGICGESAGGLNGKPCRLYELTERLTGGQLPKVYICDLREELKQGNRSIFSRQLTALLADRLEKRQQTMLFLNRRGYAGFVSCRACGMVMKCLHCEVSLSEHKNGRLVCHYCGYVQPMVQQCPICGSKYIAGFKAGTQQIEEGIKQLFPAAGVLRMDADTTKNKNSYEKILSAFAEGDADILVGTQMIVKGHDFPNVTLVGVLAADISLNANDYRAGERTFQLLTQAAGRAGRGREPGEVVIQTYQPEHYSILHASRQDYKGFYEEEILYREMLSYPPAAQMMVLLVSSLEEEKGMALAKRLGERAREFCRERGMEEAAGIIGPAAASIGKVKDIYRTVLYLKHKQYSGLIRIKDMLEVYINGLELTGETVQFDFNPMHGY